jgi:hypothetical protein
MKRRDRDQLPDAYWWVILIVVGLLALAGFLVDRLIL